MSVTKLISYLWQFREQPGSRHSSNWPQLNEMTYYVCVPVPVKRLSEVTSMGHLGMPFEVYSHGCEQQFVTFETKSPTNQEH